MKLTSLRVLASAGLLVACAQGESRGFTNMREEAKPFAQAHAECLVAGMNVGGFSSVPQLRAYDACMERNGWRDQRTLFAGGSNATPAANTADANRNGLSSCRAQAIANSISGTQLHSYVEGCMNGAAELTGSSAGKSFDDCRPQAVAAGIRGEALNGFMDACVGR